MLRSCLADAQGAVVHADRHDHAQRCFLHAGSTEHDHCSAMDDSVCLPTASGITHLGTAFAGLACGMIDSC
jgi:hypothetical protein